MKLQTATVLFATVVTTHMAVPSVVAGPITVTTFASTQVPPGDSDSDQINGTLALSTDLELMSSSSLLYTESSYTLSGESFGYGFVEVTSGMLSLGVETYSTTTADISGGNPTGGSQAAAGVNVRDGLTVTDGPGSGFLSLNFAIDGLLTTSTSGPSTLANVASSGAQFFVNSNTNPDLLLSGSSHSQNGGAVPSDADAFQFQPTWQVLIPYTSSFANMILNLSSGSNNSLACGPGFGSCTATAWGQLGNTITTRASPNRRRWSFSARVSRPQCYGWESSGRNSAADERTGTFRTDHPVR